MLFAFLQCSIDAQIIPVMLYAIICLQFIVLNYNVAEGDVFPVLDDESTLDSTRVLDATRRDS